MKFNLGAKLGGFLDRHPIGKSKPKPAATPGQASTSAGKSGFQVLGRAQHPQSGTRPQPGAVPAPPAGWSSSTVGLQYPTHTGPANMGPANERPEFLRSGSPLQPNGVQYTQFGGADESVPRGPLRITNPDLSPSSSASSSRSSTPSEPFPPPMHAPSNHPASLTPGMGTAPRIPLSADLTFEQPTASRTQHPPSLTPGMGAAHRQEVSSDPLFQGPAPTHPHQGGNPAQRLTDIPRPLGPRPMNPGNG